MISDDDNTAKICPDCLKKHALRRYTRECYFPSEHLDILMSGKFREEAHQIVHIDTIRRFWRELSIDGKTTLVLWGKRGIGKTFLAVLIGMMVHAPDIISATDKTVYFISSKKSFERMKFAFGAKFVDKLNNADLVIFDDLKEVSDKLFRSVLFSRMERWLANVITMETDPYDIPDFELQSLLRKKAYLIHLAQDGEKDWFY